MALGTGVRQNFDDEEYLLTSAPYSEDEAKAHAEALRNGGYKTKIVPHQTAEGMTYQVWRRAARIGVDGKVGRYACYFCTSTNAPHSKAPYDRKGMYWHLREVHNLGHKEALVKVKQSVMGPAQRAYYEIERRRATGEDKIVVKGEPLSLVSIYTGYDPRGSARNDAARLSLYGPVKVKQTPFGTALYARSSGNVQSVTPKDKRRHKAWLRRVEGTASHRPRLTR